MAAGDKDKNDSLYSGAKKVFALTEKLDSFENRNRKKKEEKARKKEEERLKKQEELKQKDINTKKLLSEASFSEMNGQQKVFISIKLFFYAGMPFFIYMFTPAIIIALCTGLIYGDFKNISENYRVTANNFYSFIGIVCALIFIFRSSRKRGSTVSRDITFSLKDLNWKYMGFMFLFGFSASVCISALLTLLPDSLMAGYDAVTSDVRNGYDMVLALVTVSVIDPVAEEIVFRGYMLNRLLPTLKEKVSIIIVTAIFSLCHLSPLWILYGIVLGWVLAKISIRHDNIAYSIAIHSGFNMTVVVNYLISKNELLEKIFFGSRFTIAAYALLFGAAVYALILYYNKSENLGLRLWPRS